MLRRLGDWLWWAITAHRHIAHPITYPLYVCPGDQIILTLMNGEQVMTVKHMMRVDNAAQLVAACGAKEEADAQ